VGEDSLNFVEGSGFGATDVGRGFKAINNLRFERVGKGGQLRSDVVFGQTKDGGNPGLKEIFGFRGNFNRGFVEVTSAFGVANETVLNAKILELVSVNGAGITAGGKGRDILSTKRKRSGDKREVGKRGSDDNFGLWDNGDRGNRFNPGRNCGLSFVGLKGSNK